VKRFIKYLLRRAGYDCHPISLPPTLRDLNPDVTDDEWAIYPATRPLTMLTLERILANLRAIEHIVQKQVPGDVVECGVWRGGNAMAMAMALLRLSDTSRALWLYDTFQGMTDATDADKSHTGIAAEELLRVATQSEVPECSHILAYASLEDVRNNIATTGYPMSRIWLVEGPVEQTIRALCQNRSRSYGSIQIGRNPHVIN
jgi:hypothetical protein